MEERIHVYTSGRHGDESPPLICVSLSLLGWMEILLKTDTTRRRIRIVVEANRVVLYRSSRFY